MSSPVLLAARQADVLYAGDMLFTRSCRPNVFSSCVDADASGERVVFTSR